MARSKLHRRYVKNPGTQPRRNPPLFTDLLEFVAPGFASFAATRLGTRIAATQIDKWKPGAGKHAGAGISIAAFLAAWFLGHRVKWLAKYHTPITVGAAIAGLQSLIQLYLPKLGWMVADATPELASQATAAALVASQSNNDLQLQPVDEDPNEYTYNDSYDAGRLSRHHRHGPQQNTGGEGAAAKGSAQMVDDSDLAIDDAIGQSANLGVFSN